MPDLKPLSKEAIPQALSKVTRYRLLNEPWQAESICRDILASDPGNQEALYNLILAISDQFGGASAMGAGEALKLTEGLNEDHLRFYGRGIIFERYAAVAREGRSPHAAFIAYEHLQQAMAWYEKAEKARPENNADAILRWNACVRTIQRHRLHPAPQEEGHPPMLE